LVDRSVKRERCTT